MYYVLAIIGGALLLLTSALYGGKDRFLDRTIKGETVLSPQWIEITPDSPLKAQRDVQAIVLYLEEPLVGDLAAGGVRMPDGSIVIPEVQLIDVDGNIYTLKYQASFGKQLVLYSDWDNLKGREYRSVRIRADQSVRCKEIFWRCYYKKDVN